MRVRGKLSAARPKTRPLACAVGLLATIALLLVPASASALLTHPFLETFGSAAQPAFVNPAAVAVDQSSGDLLVADREAGTLSRFNPDGSPANFSALATNVIGGLSFGGAGEAEIAIDESGGATDGDIYLTQAGSHGKIEIFAADGSHLGALTEYEEGAAANGPLASFGETCGVAVDGAGAVYVGDFSGGIHKYLPAANPPVNADNVANFTALGQRCTLAAGAGPSAGYLFSNSFGGALSKLDSANGEFKYEVSTGNRAVAVDPGNGDVFTATESEVKEFDASGATEATLLSSFAPGGEVRSVAVDATTGNLYVVGSAAAVKVFGPAVILPDPTTEPADAIGPTGATLHGTINAAGGPDASCEFQYTSEEAFQADKAEGQGHDGFQGATSVECIPHGPFTGSSTEAVSAPIANLAVGTDYRFRVVGANVNGSNPGQPLGFTTLGPTVVSSTVTNITTTSAILTGFVNPHGKAFSYHVDYGPNASYGTSVPVPDAAAEATPIGTGNIAGSGKIEGVVMSQGAFEVGQDIVGEGIKPGTTITAIEGSTLTLSEFPTKAGPVSFTSTTVFVSQPITGLTSGTEYHARLVATNADATYLGPDRGFSTYPIDTGLPDGRAYEMVSSPQKIGEVYAPEPSGSLGGSCSFEFCLPGLNDAMLPMQATADGEALAFVGQPFSSGLASSSNQYVAKRSSTDWATRSITPPRSATGRQSGFKAFSADLTRGVLQQATPALSEEVPPGENGKDFNDLYLWEAGNPNLRPLVTVRPPHRTPTLPSNPDAFELFFAGGNAGGGEAPAFSHLVFEANDALTPAVSSIAPPAPEVGEGACEGFAASDCNLYEWVAGQLRLVNVLPGNAVAASGAMIGSGHRLGLPNPENQSANVDHAISADGRRIFWSDGAGQVYVRIDGKETLEIKDPDHGQFLTASADGSKVLLSDGCLYSLAEEECEAQLSATPSAFLGSLGATQDLSRIYFADKEALAGAVEAGTCEPPLGGVAVKEEEEGKVPAGLGCNVYAYDEGDVSFVTALNKRDNNFGTNSNYGDWKAAPSNRTAQVSADGRYLSFTSYARLTGYDNRVAGGGPCLKSFGPACFEVFEYDLETDSLSCPSCNPSGQRPLGKANLSLIRPTLGSSFRQPENLPSDGEGRLFFESGDVLTTADTNGHINDVYEWTPNGVGSCKRAAGCIGLISSGHSPNDSFFLNSTPSGNDAFFVTREQLLARDKDDFLDVYDARVNGGIAEEIVPPCAGQACRGPSSSPPPAGGPGTSTFSGPANKKHHHKHKKHRKHKAKKAHKRSAQHKQTGGSK